MAVNFMQWGADWFQQMRTSHATAEVTYERPGVFTRTMPASFSRTSHQAEEDGVVITFEVWSFILRRDQLLDAGGQPVLPEVGDLVRYTRGGKTYRYDVTHGPDGRCWADHDRFKNSIVVFATGYE